MKAIIPCAGFGTRMNMRPDESKELVHYNGRPLIAHTIELCKETGLTPHLIIRDQKRDLIQYCEVNDIDYQIVLPTKEWNESLLQSQLYWDTYNFLILPDTIFKPKSAIKSMKINLEFGVSLALAIHKVDDVSKWGQVTNGMIFEKPSYQTPGYAWGVMGFHKSMGHLLFSNLYKGGSIYIPKTSYILLDEFKDVTRGNSET